jgi:hypothetical protein
MKSPDNLKFINETSHSLMEYQPSIEQKERFNLLKRIIVLLEVNHIRYSILGGYGLDGLSGELTRDHKDIDMIVDTEDIEKTRALLNEVEFKRQKNKESGVEVYLHNFTKTELELADLKFVKNLFQGDLQILIPSETNASLDGISFRTATLDGQEAIIRIQQERFKSKSPNAQHDGEIIRKLKGKI